jgi:hypothetical protein
VWIVWIAWERKSIVGFAHKSRVKYDETKESGGGWTAQVARRRCKSSSRGRLRGAPGLIPSPRPWHSCCSCSAWPCNQRCDSCGSAPGLRNEARNEVRIDVRTVAHTAAHSDLGRRAGRTGLGHSEAGHSATGHSGPVHSGPVHSGPVHSGPVHSVPGHSGLDRRDARSAHTSPERSSRGIPEARHSRGDIHG